MPADVLRRGVEREVEAEGDGIAQVRGCERVVHGGQDAGVTAERRRAPPDPGPSSSGSRWSRVEEFAPGSGVAHLSRSVRVDERRLDAEAREDGAEQRHRASVESGSRHGPRAGLRDGEEEREIAAMPEANPIADSDPRDRPSPTGTRRPSGSRSPANTRTPVLRRRSLVRTPRSSRSGTWRTGRSARCSTAAPAAAAGGDGPSASGSACASPGRSWPAAYFVHRCG